MGFIWCIQFHRVAQFVELRVGDLGVRGPTTRTWHEDFGGLWFKA